MARALRWLALLAVVGCAPVPVPAPAPCHEVSVEKSSSPSPSPSPSAETAQVAPGPTEALPGRSDPLDLVQHDGELLLYADVRALRRSVLYGPLTQLWAMEEHGLREIRERCDLDPFTAVDSLAVSVHRMRAAEQDFLVVARPTVSAQRVLACFRELWSNVQETELYGHRIIIDGRYRALAATEAGGLVFFGGPLAVHRALQRRKTARTRAAGTLSSALEPERHAFGVVVEPHDLPIEYGLLRARVGHEQIHVRGHGRFRATRRSAVQAARSFHEDFEDGRREVGEELADLLGEGHALLAELEDATIRRDGARIDVELTADTPASMGSELEAVVRRLDHRESVKEARPMP